MGCDRAARASLLQIHDTAAQAVASCVGPRGQSPARSFNSLAFYDDRTRAEWWVTVGRPDDFLYYHVDVEQSLEVFMVRMEVAIASLLVWVRLSCVVWCGGGKALADVVVVVFSIRFDRGIWGRREWVHCRTAREGGRDFDA